jgi:dTDP-4-amino-4,6-dideoxygalactose transaminase
MKNSLDRRRFMATSAAASAALSVTSAAAAEEGKPALLGGKSIRREPFPGWPRSDQRDERNLLEVLHSGKWFRGDGTCVNQFEAAFAALTGGKHCVATANGTSALYASLAALGVEPGDEVIVPPYTFNATINAVLLQYALPVFVDTDPETFQVDARKIEAAISDRTTAILPVHLGGSAADMDTILEVARKHRIPVIEDACQAHLAEWRGKKVGTLGAAGCFSFQVSKNLCSGEGGAILTADAELAERCYLFHNNNHGRVVTGYNPTAQGGRGANLRMTEFQGNLLLAQMTRLAEQSATREEHARYLTRMLKEIPGITPAKMYQGCTRNAYHLYMFRYQSEAFGGLPRARLLAALRAEGIPCSAGYSPLNKESFLPAALSSRGFRRIFRKETMDSYQERNQCPANDQLCKEAVWFTQSMFLGTRSDMDEIAAAVRKVRAGAEALLRA